MPRKGKSMSLKTTFSGILILALLLSTPALVQTSQPVRDNSLDVYDKSIADATTPMALIDAYSKRALALSSPVMKRYDQAIEDMTKVISLSKKNGLDPATIGMDYNTRAIIRERNGDIAGAVEDYTNAIEATLGKNKDYYNFRAGDYEDLNLREKALNDYTTAIALSGDHSDWLANFRRGSIYFEQKEFNKAIADLTRSLQAEIVKSDTTLAVRSYNQRGVAYLAINKTKEAFDDFNKAVKTVGILYYIRGITPPSEFGSISFNNRGKAAYLEGMAEKDVQRRATLMNAALADLNFAILLSPKPIDRMFSNRGHIYLEKAKLGVPSAAEPTLKLAQMDFDKVLELNKTNPSPELVKDAVATKEAILKYESSMIPNSTTLGPSSATPPWLK
jgi:tetratricopeptide (TPR) repeat protein